MRFSKIENPYPIVFKREIKANRQILHEKDDYPKLRSLAMQAMALDASALKKDTLPEKRYTLIVALLNRMRGVATGLRSIPCTE
jgi:hypothetical protein